MNWPDAVNGTFELLAGGFLLNNCRVLYKDKVVKGVSKITTTFLVLWGIWNLYYYPHLGQIFSFWGGIGVVASNALYLSMMVYYRNKDHEQ